LYPSVIARTPELEKSDKIVLSFTCQLIEVNILSQEIGRGGYGGKGEEQRVRFYFLYETDNAINTSRV